jgi:hypothetical protein
VHNAAASADPPTAQHRACMHHGQAAKHASITYAAAYPCLSPTCINTAGSVVPCSSTAVLMQPAVAMTSCCNCDMNACGRGRPAAWCCCWQELCAFATASIIRDMACIACCDWNACMPLASELPADGAAACGGVLCTATEAPASSAEGAACCACMEDLCCISWTDLVNSTCGACNT